MCSAHLLGDTVQGVTRPEELLGTFKNIGLQDVLKVDERSTCIPYSKLSLTFIHC